ncbi:hypothetical protein Sjap_006398 [Stephania japonica]|uniref:Hexosyltransferase n=1 Tax=Stephania japonica TaxID=461633 RepID=A0AAP0K6Y1_9MAGN
MKLALKCQRISLLVLLSLSVLSPIVLVSHRLSKITSSIAHREFVQDVASIQSNAEILNAIHQEVEGLSEPTQVLYKDERSVSSVGSIAQQTANLVAGNVSGTNQDGSEDKKYAQVENVSAPLVEEKRYAQEKNLSAPLTEEKRNAQEKNVSLPLVRGKGRSDQTGRVETNRHIQPQRVNDERVREMRDQLIQARAYLSLAPPNSNSPLVKELRLRIKEVERSLGDATKDSNLPRSSLQKMRAMDATLSKASTIYDDCAAMASKLRAMEQNFEEQVRAQKNQATYLTHLAARTTPKGLHCLSMQLTTDYFDLHPKDQRFPKQQNLNNQDLYHYAVFSDNVLACAVVVNSTVSASMEPERVVLHVVTDAVNFPAMTMWFLLNPPGKATIEVKNIDDLSWIPSKHVSMLKEHDSGDSRYTSVLNHLRFYLPEMFPSLHKIVLLDHDVVVQRDLKALWRTNMQGKVNGAVENCLGNLSFRQMFMLLNISDPSLSRDFDAKACAWAFGMNLFDLREWRRQNITALYHKYLELGKKQQVWKSGSMPLGLLTFYNQTVVLDRRWHVLGLGYESGVRSSDIERAAVIHYDGDMKPWLEIGISKYKSYWSKYVNYDHPYLQRCNIHE